MIYLDHAASWPVFPEVAKFLEASFRQDFANPMAQHRLGRDQKEKLEAANDFFRRQYFGDKYWAKGHFFFTSSATEANNWAIGEFLAGAEASQKKEIFYSPADHASIVVPLEMLATENFELKIIPRDEQGHINWVLLQEQIGDQTHAVFLTHVNSQSGQLDDIFYCAELLKKKNSKIKIHIDGSQAFARHEIYYRPGVVDSYTISAHKLGGPKGVAGIYFEQRPERPFLFGGGQEESLRASTPATNLILAFQHSVQLLHRHQKELLSEMTRFNQMVRHHFSNRQEVEFPFKLEETSPYILMLVLEFPSDVILRHLEMEEIFCASTSACSSKIKDHNPTLADLGVPAGKHKNVLRISFGPDNTEPQVQFFITTLDKVLALLKRLGR